MKQGKGIWLNPGTLQWRYVTKHERFLYYRQDEARELGIPDDVLKKISGMNVVEHETPIRIEAIKAGMVRMRDKWSEVIAQFYADHDVRDILRAIRYAINDVPEYKHAWHIKVDNLYIGGYRPVKYYSQRKSESSPSKLHAHISKHDTGIITAWRHQVTDEDTGNVIDVTNSQNRMRNAQLFSVLNGRYAITTIMGSYIENCGTQNEVEVKGELFFVVNVDDLEGMEDDLRCIGEKWNQDSILFVPKGGRQGVLWGTNLNPVDKSAIPPYGKKRVLNKPLFDADRQLIARDEARPFVFESVGLEYGKRPRMAFFSEWGRYFFRQKDWKDGYPAAQ